MKKFKALLKGGNEIVLTDAQADHLSTLMMTGQSGQVVRLKEHDLTLRVSDIRRVERDLDGERKEHARNVEATQQQLLEAKATERRKGCRGQYSIQQQVNRIIQDENPVTWPKVIRDSKTRGNIREVLLTTSSEWCDYESNACHCDPDFAPQAKRVNFSL